MTEADVSAFSAQIRRLTVAFRPLAAVEDVIREYWGALENLPLHGLVHAIDQLLATAEHWPKPADIRAHCHHDGPRGAAIPLATQAEADLYDEAERTQWERPPCGCPECLKAGVEERPMRFVPIGDEPDRRQHPRRQAVFLPGEWIHSFALARWLNARADFYEQFARATAKGSVQTRLGRVERAAQALMDAEAQP